MRRGLPWALAGLVLLAAGLGAGLGLAGAPTGAPDQAWVDQVLSTTQAAGTVRFSYSSVTTSSNPLLRASRSGSGSADFASGSATSTEFSRQTSLSGTGSTSALHATTSTQRLDEVSLGHTTYVALSLPGQVRPVWAKMGRTPTAFAGVLGLGLGYTTAAGALDALTGANRVVRIEDLGSNVVDGIPATRYRVVTQPVCAGPPSRSDGNSTGPTDLWLDGEGRLIRAQGTSYSSVRGLSNRAPSPPPGFEGSATTTNVIRFHDFGSPVRISAPDVATGSLIHAGISVFRLHCTT
ncbi:MAG: hypothetical protein QOJ44_2474 [Acidimicrobiaceae bacterium]|jgi:hypothetical protein|nr:hypothetical protein [Acidimicrobiaceae bacterium]